MSDERRSGNKFFSPFPPVDCVTRSISETRASAKPERDWRRARRANDVNTGMKSDLNIHLDQHCVRSFVLISQPFSESRQQ